jgi:hypothetical protein
MDAVNRYAKFDIGQLTVLRVSRTELWPAGGDGQEIAGGYGVGDFAGRQRRRSATASGRPSQRYYAYAMRPGKGHGCLFYPRSRWLRDGGSVDRRLARSSAMSAMQPMILVDPPLGVSEAIE